MRQPEPVRSLSSSPLRLAGVLLAGLVFTLAVAVVLGGGGAGSGAVVSGGSLLALLPAAFLAGLLSFIAPCTLPLLPAYFAYTFQSRTHNVTLMTVAFFWGLATTLTLLGATTTALSRLLNVYARQLALVGGLLVIVFGVLSLLGLGFSGMRLAGRPAATLVGSYLYGATFALGWSTCIGPILGAILTLLAAQGSSIAQGALLAFVYALGLGAPLIVVASFFDRLGTGSRFWRLLKGRGWAVSVGRATLHLHSTGIASGLLLIGMGALLASGRMAELTQLAAGSDLSRWIIESEEHLRGWFGLP
ncbi:MAG TPA: cytochrome c biogenesis protein CcdA [Thermomicrobiales bacterium]|jgi:cytochrome c-type biogenesis protein